MKVFDKAILRLTALYTAILLLISVGFSVLVFNTTTRGMERRLSMPQEMVFRVVDGANELEAFMRERDTAVKQELLARLALLNISVAVLGSIVSYFLACRTLKPINEAYEKQGQFVSDASHELRTPLTAIQMENEVLLKDQQASRGELRQQVKSNLEEVQKLQKLTSILLELGNNKAQNRDKTAIVERIVQIFRENAIKYDPEHRQPIIKRGKNRIDVIDKGVGIDEKDLPHIFERFYRADKSRSSDGYGLGLALAQELAKEIGAKIEVKNNQADGATFSLILPVSSGTFQQVRVN
ncbi:MAG: HAMP domain-containing histidine kinase [Candidatus Nomurabacteria bacterium]|jgi:signal transduction histidine kinase|nr:HAMP domain-containing histidine kinase [Candidatus Nomurabacteria bacterium]